MMKVVLASKVRKSTLEALLVELGFLAFAKSDLLGLVDFWMILAINKFSIFSSLPLALISTPPPSTSS